MIETDRVMDPAGLGTLVGGDHCMVTCFLKGTFSLGGASTVVQVTDRSSVVHLLLLRPTKDLGSIWT